MRADTGAAGAYFRSMRAALKGLRVYLAGADSPLYAHGLIGQVITPYVDRLEATFAAWENRVGFLDRFRISRADSGFPMFQNVLTLENDRSGAAERLAAIPDVETLKAEMADLPEKKDFDALGTKERQRISELSGLNEEQLREGMTLLAEQEANGPRF